MIRTFWIIMLAIFTMLMHGCLNFKKNDKRVARQIEKEGNLYTVAYDSVNSKSVRYLHYQHVDPSAPLLLFIHGAPGSSSALSDFMKDEGLRSDYAMMVIDRPGYGETDYGNYTPIIEQAKTIISFIEKNRKSDQKVYIAGHSYGGTIAGYLAILNPSWLEGVVMIAPAIDPDHEKYFWFGKLGLYKSTRWMASKALQVASLEKYNHEEELSAFKDRWKEIQTPILHIHGDHDKVVPFENLSFSKANIPESYLYTEIMEGDNHFIPFKKTDELAEMISSFIQSIRK